MSNRKDLPSPNATNFLPRVREEIHALLGKTGRDRALMLQDAIDTGLLVPGPGGTLTPGTVPSDPGGGGAVYVPDLTPPPQPAGFDADAAISHVNVWHDAPLYTQGHGHQRTRVYGATVLAGDPLPVFANAVEIDQFTGVFRSIPSNPSTTWRLWAKWESVDGVLSATPAGGTNGVEARTGEDVGLLLDALAGQITASELHASLSTPIGQIGGIVSDLAQEAIDRAQGDAAEALERANAIAQEQADRAAGLAQEQADRVAGLAQEQTDRAAQILAETSQRQAALLAESNARATAIGAIDAAIRADIATADQAVVTALQSQITSGDASTLASVQAYAYSKAQTDSAVAAQGSLLQAQITSGDSATLASAQNYSYSKAQTDSALAAQSTSLQAQFTAADAVALASAQNFTYSRAAIDSADAATLATLRSEFAAADSTTLASAQNYTFSQAQINSAVAASSDTLRAQLTGGSSSTSLGSITSGLIQQVNQASVTRDDALAQQLTLLSAGAGEQFDYTNIWYFDADNESWTPDDVTNTSMTAVGGFLRMVSTSGTQTARRFQSPDNLNIQGSKYTQVKLRLRRVGAPTWAGRLYFTTTTDAVWNTTKSVVIAAPTWTSNIAVVTFNMPAGWTAATIRQIRLEASTTITTAVYIEMDWAAVGRPSPGASSAQLTSEQIARAQADAALASDITTLNGSLTTLTGTVATKAAASALTSLETRVTAAEGVNTSQGSSITALDNSLTTLTGTVGTKAAASALTALETRVTATEGVNTSQGSSITTLNNSLTTLTGTVNTKANASAVTALETRVTAAEGVNTSQGTSITSLQNSVTALGTSKADASAVTSLTTRVTAAEGVNTSQGTSITTLNNSVTTINGTLATKADASALTTLANTVTAQGGTIASQGTAITSVQASVQRGQNLADIDWWNAAGVALPAGWAWNGAVSENSFVDGIDHAGKSSVLLRMESGAGGATINDGDGGIQGGKFLSAIDRTKTYRFAIPVRRDNAIVSTMYLGTGGVCNLNTNVANGNPYFVAQQLHGYGVGEWFMMVGYVFPEGSTGKTNAGAGVFRVSTGERVVTGTNFCWHPTNTPTYRAFQFYSQAAGAIAHFGRPMIHIVDGSEPLLESILLSASSLNAAIATKASASALTALDARVTSAEGVNTSQGSSITSLNNSLATLTTTVATKADATALTALTTRVTSAEGVNTSQGSAITALDNSLTTLTGTVNGKASAAALSALDSRVTAAEGVNTSQGSSITSLNSSLATLTTTVSTKADASALTALTTRVTAAEGVNTSQGTSITSLNNSLTTTNSNVTTAQAAATAAATLAGSKGKVLVQAAAPAAGDQLAQNLWIDITGGANTPKRWNGSAWAAVTDKVATDAATAAANALTVANTKADASAVTSLTTRVTAAEGVNTSQATAITGLQASVTTINGTLATKADASALTTTNTNVSTLGGTVTAQAGQITTLQSRIDRGSSIAPRLEDWKNLAGHNIVTIADGKVGDKALRLTNVVSNPNSGVMVPIDRTKKYRVRFWARPSADCNGVLYHALHQFIDAAGTQTGPVNSGLSPYKPSAVSRAAHNALHGVDQWGEYSYLWTTADWQAGVAHVRPTFLRNYPGGAGTAGHWEVQDYEFLDATATESLNAALQVEAATRATQAGELYAQYTVKTDVGGLVSGYGLASTASNAAPTSAFGVQAGQFFVAPPAVSSATAPAAGLFKGYAWRDTTTNTTKYWTGSAWSTTPQALPFVVQTVAEVINGFTVQPGIYGEAAFFSRLVATRGQIGLLSVDGARIADAAIESAKIADAAITTAKIGDAQITTAKIANAAIGTAQIGTAQVTTANIADLSVSTLKLQDQAVTLPMSSTASRNIDSISAPSYSDIVTNTLSIVSTGAPAFVFGNGLWRSTSNSGYFMFELAVDGVAHTNYYTNWAASNGSPVVSLIAVSMTLTPGPHTLTLRYYETIAPGTIKIGKTTLLYLEVKK